MMLKSPATVSPARPSPLPGTLTPPQSTARGASYRHNPYGNVSATVSTVSPPSSVGKPLSLSFTGQPRAQSMATSCGVSATEYPAVVSGHTSPSQTPLVAADFAPPGAWGESTQRGYASHSQHGTYVYQQQHGAHSFPPSPPMGAIAPFAGLQLATHSPLQQALSSPLQHEAEKRSASMSSALAFSMGSGITPVPAPGGGGVRSPHHHPTLFAAFASPTGYMPSIPSSQTAKPVAQYHNAPLAVRVGAQATEPAVTRQQAPPPPPPPAYGLADPQCQHFLQANVRRGSVFAPPATAPTHETLPYVILDSVRSATIRGEARKSGTRIGEAAAAWDGATRFMPHALAAMGRMVDIFVAQLPFDLALSILQEVADAVVPGPPLRIIRAAPHLRKGRAYDGCAFFRMPESDAARFVAAMHKRVLFDVDGVWVAQSDEQQSRLLSYCRWMQEKRPEERRVVLPRPTPFSAMTAEYALRDMLSVMPRGAPENHFPALV